MVTLLKGGTSAEREVSLSSARTIAASLTELGIDFREVDAADSDWIEQVKQHNSDVVFLALHGPYGEDGQVQKLLEGQKIRFTGSGSEASKLCIDKTATKSAVVALGVKVARSETFSSPEGVSWAGAFPVVVKPNGDGSSFGITIVREPNELQGAVEEAFKFGKRVMVEEYLRGIELTCGVIYKGDRMIALPLVEIRPKGEFFDYDAKYDTESGCAEICPAEIPEDIGQMIQSLSLNIAERVGVRQYCRIDWILEGDTPYFLEVNTLPGMTRTSLINKELAAYGLSFNEFISELIRTASFESVTQ